MFQVHNRTRFPLFAVHAKVDCQACHRGQRPFEYATTTTECGGCHARAFEATTSPNHVAAGFSRRCEDCHRPTAMDWRSSAFNHTTFPLRGVHSRTACAQCHTSGYRGTPRDCVGCHRPNYDRAQNPNHVTSRFPLQCGSCHQETGWRPASGVDHALTRFPLTGAHQRVECARCHVGGKYTGTPTQCVACHQADYTRTVNPNHASGRFSNDCENCHTTAAWRPATIDHNKTAFPLSGAHQQVECALCHVGGRYAGTPKDCYSCHQKDYTRVTNPNHVAGRFSTTCDDCHSTNAWRPASIDHNKTAFPLTGAHRGVNCEACHKGGKYAGTSKDCFSCHASDYSGTNNPNHAAAGFPKSCQDCHKTSGWKPATFDHDGAFFPIYSGKHKGKWSACNDCHKNPGNYKAFECIVCHSNKADLDSKHKGVSGYSYSSTACYRCHPQGRAE
jgi:nitrate/TMAO reductase-like tetraheme cytochrome c subunit